MRLLLIFCKPRRTEALRWEFSGSLVESGWNELELEQSPHNFHKTFGVKQEQKCICISLCLSFTWPRVSFMSSD